MGENIGYSPLNNIQEKENMDKTFYITYYASKHKKHITRKGKWKDKCRYWTSKLGDSLITYFDMDKDAYRTAKGSWKVRL